MKKLVTLHKLVKYENRKIYNTNLHKYVNLTEIKKFVLDGNEIMVYDKKTNKCITKDILVDVYGIILKNTKISKEFLHKAIRQGRI